MHMDNWLGHWVRINEKSKYEPQKRLIVKQTIILSLTSWFTNGALG